MLLPLQSELVIRPPPFRCNFTLVRNPRKGQLLVEAAPKFLNRASSFRGTIGACHPLNAFPTEHRYPNVALLASKGMLNRR
jgi:hypothetical protein